MSAVQYVHRTTCALDGGPDTDCRPHWNLKFRAPDHESGLGEFDLIYCSKCQVGFTDPYPTEETSGLLYTTKSTADFDVIQDTLVDRAKDLIARRLSRSLARGRDPASIQRVLDFSCGNARHAGAARDVFPNAQVDAVDFQPQPPPLIHKPGSTRLSYYQLERFDETDTRYDIIFLRHVLEHTHDPVGLLRKLAGRLAPTGVLYIEVPNLDSGCGRLFGKHWKGWYMPRHIFHYTPASLAEIVKRAGLTGELGSVEPPHMGNMVSILLGAKKSNFAIQVLGALLHPLQLVTEWACRSSSCITLHAVHSR